MSDKQRLWLVYGIGVLLTLTLVPLALLSPIAAAAIAGLILLVIAVRNLRILIVATGITLPFSAVLAVQAQGTWIAACDVLAVLTVLAYAALSWKRRDRAPAPILRAIRPALWLVAPYLVVAGVAAAFFFSTAHTWLTIVQRAELVLLWLVFGSVVVKARAIRPFLAAFVLTCLALSVAWILTPGASGVLGVQKNPSGGFISAALIIVLLARHRFRILALVILTGGLIATGSRGAIVGLLVAAVVLVFMRQQWKRVLLPLVLAGGAGLAVLYALPDEVAARLLGQDQSSAYTETIRTVFVNDALFQWHLSQGRGVGVGNYVQADPALSRVLTHDPHNVFVLALVEGGIPLIAAFILLVGGTLIWLLRMPKTALVVAAIAVQVSTFAHAYVDVYWVRGTPAMGWALVGIAATLTYMRKQELTAEPAPAARNVREPARR